MKLTIKLLEREPFVIEVNQTIYIKEMKRILNEELRIPIDEQKLIYRGMILHDDKQLSNYSEISDGVTLNLIMVTQRKYPVYKKVYEIIRKNNSEKDTQRIVSAIMREIYNSFGKLNLDDLEGIARYELDNETKLEKMQVD